MNVYVIRHGQSETNVSTAYCGWSQVNLTEEGRRDAARAGKLLAGISFDRVYCSDLVRAIQTCRIALPGVPFTEDPLLREIGVGDLAGLFPEEAQARYGEQHRLASLNRDFTAFRGENTAMHNARTAAFMRRLENEAPGETVAVFTHEGSVKGMLSYILGVQYPFGSAVLLNGSVSVFSLTDGHWRLVHWNLI